MLKKIGVNVVKAITSSTAKALGVNILVGVIGTCVQFGVATVATNIMEKQAKKKLEAIPEVKTEDTVELKDEDFKEV